MTQYTLRCTIAAPVALLSDCNALAVCLGESAGDASTFTQATHVDASGNEYAVASTVAKQVFIDMSESPMEAPPYAPDVDLEAASRAQTLLSVNDRATPDRVAAIIGDRHESAQSHVEALGLTIIEVPDA